MISISVSHLKKYFTVYQRKENLFSSLTSLFTKEAHTVQAVDDISFTVEQGELVGFIGPNGAGKTTVLKCLSGLLYPSGGKLDVLGFDPYKRKNEFLKKISLVMGQKNQLWWNLSARETFRLNKEIYDIPEEQYQQTLRELSSLLDADDILFTPVRHLSLGQRMKMELIAVLLHRPKILFLDEPTIGLDVVMQKNIRDFISRYNKKYRATILLTSHYMEDVKELCSRVIVIDKGKLLYDGLLVKLVQKYAGFKIIQAVLASTKPSLSNLEKVGEVRSYCYPEVSFIIKKNRVKQAALSLLKNFEVDDLNITEPDIEEVIRNLFTGGKR